MTIIAITALQAKVDRDDEDDDDDDEVIGTVIPSSPGASLLPTLPSLLLPLLVGLDNRIAIDVFVQNYYFKEDPYRKVGSFERVRERQMPSCLFLSVGV